jgi:hypothetical protein
VVKWVFVGMLTSLILGMREILGLNSAVLFIRRVGADGSGGGVSSLTGLGSFLAALPPHSRAGLVNSVAGATQISFIFDDEAERIGNDFD